MLDQLLINHEIRILKTLNFYFRLTALSSNKTTCLYDKYYRFYILPLCTSSTLSKNWAQVASAESSKSEKTKEKTKSTP